MLFFYTFADIKRNKSENSQTKRKQKVIQNGKLFKIQVTSHKQEIPTQPSNNKNITTPAKSVTTC